MAKAKVRFSIGASGAVGAGVAMLADVLQKNEASALLSIGEVVGATWLGVIVVATLAVALCYIFECGTMRKAFYTGASVLTVLMTVVPYRLPPSLNTDPSKEAASRPPVVRDLGWFDLLQPGLAFAQPRAKPIAAVPVRIVLTTDDGKPVSQAIVTLRDAESGAIVGQSNLRGDTFDIYPPPGRYVLTVQVTGYGIARHQLSLRPGDPEQLRIRLESTWAPTSLQRLFRK